MVRVTRTKAARMVREPRTMAKKSYRLTGERTFFVKLCAFVSLWLFFYHKDTKEKPQRTRRKISPKIADYFL